MRFLLGCEIPTDPMSYSRAPWPKFSSGYAIGSFRRSWNWDLLIIQSQTS
jgi:hypothetical protein